MSNNPNEADDRERSITTHRETIRTWADDRDYVPVRRSDVTGDEYEYEFRRRDELDDEEDQDWDSFFTTFEDRNMALLYSDEGAESQEYETGRDYDLVDRGQALQRSAIDDAELEEQLAAGETVTTNVTETVVVEREIVEHEELETEVVDSELVREEETDRELVSRRIVDTEVFGLEEFDVDRADRTGTETVDADVGGMDTDAVETRTTDEADRTDTGTTDEATGTDERVRTTGAGVEDFPDAEVAVEIEETYLVTKERDERMTVETRVVDTDVEEHGSVEEDDVDVDVGGSRLDVESVERSLFGGEVVDHDASIDDVVGTGRVESERIEDDEGDTVRTEFLRRRVVHEEVDQRDRLRFDLADVEGLRTESRGEEIVGSEIVEGVDAETTIETDTTVETETTVDADMRTDASEDRAAGTTAESGVETDVDTDVQMDADEDRTAGTTTESGVETDADADADVGHPGAEPGEAADHPDLTDDDEGKEVVTADGMSVGIVSEVDSASGRLHVDPDPSMTDRLKASLGWGDADEDTYDIGVDSIESIEESRVLVTSAAGAEAGSDDRTV